MWREFWPGWQRVMETTEDCKDVSRHRQFTGASYIIPFEGYSAEFFAFPIFVYSFVVCSEDVTEVSCMFFSNVIYAKVINDKGTSDGAPLVGQKSWSDPTLLVAVFQ